MKYCTYPELTQKQQHQFESENRYSDINPDDYAQYVYAIDEHGNFKQCVALDIAVAQLMTAKSAQQPTATHELIIKLQRIALYLADAHQSDTALQSARALLNTLISDLPA